jgi:hypothetical protein
VIAIPFDLGTRTTSTVPLTDPASGATLMDGDSIVTLTLRWPDDPDICEEMARFMAANDALQAAKDLGAGPKALAAAYRELVEAKTAYCTALVLGWSVGAECTPAGLAALFRRFPPALTVIQNAVAENDRFLHASLRTSGNESAPSSSAPSA